MKTGRARIAVVLLVVAAFAAHALLTGSPWIETPLPGGLPLGNALSALALCALAGAALELSPVGSVLRAFANVALFAAIVWLPVSIALAGNLALNFAGGRGPAWIWLSIVIALYVLAVLLATAIRRVIGKLRRVRRFGT